MEDNITAILPQFPEILSEKGGTSEIKVGSCSIEQLFNVQNNSLPDIGISGSLSIPEYQRPYVWEEKQLQKLNSDLSLFFQEYQSGYPHYYLGSIILHQDGNQLNIIDGQQRITTLLLLSALKDIPSLPEVAYSSPVSIQRIKKNLDYLKEQLLKFDLDLDLINVTLVVTQNEDDAYTFFETQNTGGVRLSGADIIKSHHLRAIRDKHLSNVNAQKWETKNSKLIKYVIELLSKARSWNIVSWEDFPYYKYKQAIKNKVVEDFSERTLKETSNISFMQAEIKRNNFLNTIQMSSHLKAVRQPLYEGENYIDYLTEYVETYEILFLRTFDHRVDKRFYELRKKLLHGHDGTIFLKELFEILTICYVSKFGFKNIFEFSLWAFRYIYSLRVTKERTVRENSMTKFVQNERLLDKIFNCFTHAQVITLLKEYSYDFNDKNCGENNVKGRFIQGLGKYFTIHFSAGINTKNFDKNLKEEINAKL